ncbi:hypothetical protein ACSMXN_20425 [Jatrophihabitans sp. DSM 45814]
MSTTVLRRRDGRRGTAQASSDRRDDVQRRQAALASSAMPTAAFSFLVHDEPRWDHHPGTTAIQRIGGAELAAFPQ